MLTVVDKVGAFTVFSFTHVGEDLIDRLSSRIVRSDKDFIGTLNSSAQHGRALSAISVATAAENNNEAARCYLPQHGAGMGERIIGVSIIDNDIK